MFKNLKNGTITLNKVIYGRDDDDDDDDEEELFLWYGWLTKGIAFFPAGTIVGDPHHRESDRYLFDWPRKD